MRLNARGVRRLLWLYRISRRQLVLLEQSPMMPAGNLLRELVARNLGDIEQALEQLQRQLAALRERYLARARYEPVPPAVQRRAERTAYARALREICPACGSTPESDDRCPECAL